MYTFIYHARRELPGNVRSANPSRDDLGGETGRDSSRCAAGSNMLYYSMLYYVISYYIIVDYAIYCVMLYIMLRIDYVTLHDIISCCCIFLGGLELGHRRLGQKPCRIVECRIYL